MTWLKKFNLLNYFTLVGEQKQIRDFYDAMDIFCLSSKSEAFPNVLVEAMAMELPCIATNVGDVSKILENENFIVPKQNSIELSKALGELCSLTSENRSLIGNHNSRLVRKKYSVRSICTSYLEEYEKCV
jgi:glycosyltransferase involved in cell wall biosynthesis